MLPRSTAGAGMATDELGGTVAVMTSGSPGGMGGSVSVSPTSSARGAWGGTVAAVAGSGAAEGVEGQSGFMGVSQREGKVAALSHIGPPDQEKGVKGLVNQ